MTELDVMKYCVSDLDSLRGPTLLMKLADPPRPELERLMFALDPFRITGQAQPFVVVSCEHWSDGSDVFYQFTLRVWEK